jgi:hypothetical protein
LGQCAALLFFFQGCILMSIVLQSKYKCKHFSAIVPTAVHSNRAVASFLFFFFLSFRIVIVMSMTGNSAWDVPSSTGW